MLLFLESDGKCDALISFQVKEGSDDKRFRQIDVNIVVCAMYNRGGNPLSAVFSILKWGHISSVTAVDWRFFLCVSDKKYAPRNALHLAVDTRGLRPI